MIGREDSLKAVDCFIRPSVGRAVYGLQPAGHGLPLYRTHANQVGLPPVCAYSKHGGPTKARCERFYRTINGIRGTVTCPFGIMLTYSKRPEKQLGGVSLFVQIGVAVSDSMKAYTSSMPRKKKKAIESRIDEQARYQHPLPAGVPVEDFDAVVETLSAGRAAETIAAIAHEMLTPVQGALNDIEELRMQSNSGGSELYDRLERNIGSIKYLAKRVHLLLSSDVPLNTQMIRRVNLWQMVENVITALRPHGEDKAIDIEHARSQRIPRVQAIPDQLETVLNALLHNAVKYSFRGSAERSNVVSVHYSLSQKNYVVVHFNNRGCLVTDAEVSGRRIFEMNYRGEYSGDRNRAGTGTGLYAADRIVTQHHGFIEVKSAVVGHTTSGDPVAETTFSLGWPLYQPESDER